MHQSLRGEPADFQVRYNAGTLLLRENRVKAAVNELEKAHELEARDVEVILNLGAAIHLQRTAPASAGPLPARRPHAPATRPRPL